MPVPEFERVPWVLSMTELSVLRFEVLQVLEMCKYGGWERSLSAVAWRANLRPLVRYGLRACAVFKIRGGGDHAGVFDEIFSYLDFTLPADLPPWWGDPNLCRGHRAELIRRRPHYYRRLWPNQKDVRLLWPSP